MKSPIPQTGMCITRFFNKNNNFIWRFVIKFYDICYFKNAGAGLVRLCHNIIVQEFFDKDVEFYEIFSHE